MNPFHTLVFSARHAVWGGIQYSLRPLSEHFLCFASTCFSIDRWKSFTAGPVRFWKRPWLFRSFFLTVTAVGRDKACQRPVTVSDGCCWTLSKCSVLQWGTRHRCKKPYCFAIDLCTWYAHTASRATHLGVKKVSKRVVGAGGTFYIIDRQKTLNLLYCSHR